MILDKLDMALAIDKETYKKKLVELQVKMRELEFAIFNQRIPAIVVYEGWDAAGKGGNIKRVVEKLDPRGYSVISIAAPRGDEKTHQYLWRFWNHIPKAGHIAIFDRSWYGRVLVERVEGFCSTEDWKRAYQEINEFEGQLDSFGTVIVKFWINITKDEQQRRFDERQNDPFKNWKLTDEDLRNREKWDTYSEAVEEMLLRTSTHYAPWTIIEGNDKYHARIKTLQTITDAIEAALGKKPKGANGDKKKNKKKDKAK